MKRAQRDNLVQELAEGHKKQKQACWEENAKLKATNEELKRELLLKDRCLRINEHLRMEQFTRIQFLMQENAQIKVTNDYQTKGFQQLMCDYKTKEANETLLCNMIVQQGNNIKQLTEEQKTLKTRKSSTPTLAPKPFVSEPQPSSSSSAVSDIVISSSSSKALSSCIPQVGTSGEMSKLKALCDSIKP